MIRRLPALLIALRALLGPTVWLFACDRAARPYIVAALTIALLSDVFDGVLARRLGLATERLRVADSRADAFYYLCVALAVCRAAPELLRPYAGPLLAVLSLQLLSYTIDLLKYRRIVSYHAYSAKIWGVSLFFAAVALLGFHSAGVFLWLAILCGFLSNIEGLAMKCVLPTWTHDVSGLAAALRLRRRMADRS
ncbi:MAG TPA: CDP-alcohol phosphatidyltransferase family protein [Chthonomonadaceae bacterium]|nr:CDP-alcohol phosphatidyltransferase family protein [Chthonomonadaceae bacterium]